MDIEVMETKQPEPLFELLEYLNDNIYSKMSKKDVEAIKSTCLQGELVKHIMRYTQIKVDNAVIDATKTLSDLNNNQFNIIQEMRENGGKEKQVYRKRSDHFVND